MAVITIGHHACHGQDRGEWYVCRQLPDRDMWGDKRQEYLHADGIWRRSTFSGDGWGSPTGYFATATEAEAALAKARGEAVQ